MKSDQPTIAVVIPAYNAQEWISNTLDELKDLSIFKQIIVVDDGSADLTADEVRKHRFIELIRLQENRGQHHATWVGIKASNSDFVLTIDDDLPLSPAAIHQFIKEGILQNAELAYAQYSRDGNVLSRIGSWLVSKWMSLKFNQQIAGSSTRLISSGLIKSINKDTLDGYLDTHLLKHSEKTIFIPVAGFRPNLASRYSLRRRVKLFTKLLGS
ncbi:glycosyltransferase family 2 protein [Marinoscillum furvescens]|uniref:Glycosyl transferase family 2 n=1 Tax=Marinoscillum furvescens DSM 4134 TaxID=1122208 RepID=A0A3D9KWB3_MARFU|nr:glycosyltransferase family 2 protein [Marinoscillum furvescens]RED92316.1 glycosyl transferase family 2 [Marinoscillum furvescens DSM 4134]